MYKGQMSLSNSKPQWIEATKSDLLAATLHGKELEFERGVEEGVQPEDTSRCTANETAPTGDGSDTPTRHTEQVDFDILPSLYSYEDGEPDKDTDSGHTTELATAETTTDNSIDSDDHRIFDDTEFAGLIGITECVQMFDRLNSGQ